MCVIGEGSAIFTPLQRGVTVLVGLVPLEESGAVQCHGAFHVPPEFARDPIRLKFWGFGALRLCGKTYHCYLCSLRELQTIEAFMCTARQSLRLQLEDKLRLNVSLQVSSFN